MEETMRIIECVTSCMTVIETDSVVAVVEYVVDLVTLSTFSSLVKGDLALQVNTLSGFRILWPVFIDNSRKFKSVVEYDPTFQ